MLNRICISERISKCSPGFQEFYDIVKNSLFTLTSALLKVSKPHKMMKVKTTELWSAKRKCTTATKNMLEWDKERNWQASLECWWFCNNKRSKYLRCFCLGHSKCLCHCQSLFLELWTFALQQDVRRYINYYRGVCAALT